MKSKTPNKSGKNPNKSGRNPNSLKNLKPPFEVNNTAAIGHGRPRIYAEERAIKQSNYQLLNAMVQSGLYSEMMFEVIEKQTARGQFDAIKWMFENAIGSTIMAPSGQEMLDDLGMTYESFKEFKARGLPLPRIDSLT